MHSPSLFSLKPTASHWILSGDGWQHKQQYEREKQDKTKSSKDKTKKRELKLFEIWKWRRNRKRVYQSFSYWKMWMPVTVRERNVWRGKSKKCSNTSEWRDKKIGDVFIVSWFFHLKPYFLYYLIFFTFDNFPTQTHQWHHHSFILYFFFSLTTTFFAEFSFLLLITYKLN